MKKRSLRILMRIVYSVVFVILCLSPSIVLAETNVDLSTSPQSVLCSVDNVKPGDWAERGITVQNTGDANFEYTAYPHFKSGEQKLYEQLQLRVEASGKELYAGNLADFNMLGKRALANGEQEQLLFTLSLPASTGNDYQQLSVDFEMIFLATNATTPPVDEPEDPDTPTEPGDHQPNPGDETGTPSNDQNGVNERSETTANGSNEKLPDTATMMTQYMVIGGILVVGGGAAYYAGRKKSRSRHL